MQYPSVPSRTNNILLASVQAFASDSQEVPTYETNRYFHIPGLNGALVAFNIKGNSMTPTLDEGDLIICQPLERAHEVRENDVYAVAAQNTLRVKRIHRITDYHNQLTHLELLSDNYLEHPSILVPIQEVRQIYKVVRRLTQVYAHR
jgi:phage repressor protein C with HTH and peptisase S24 domain